MLWEGRQEFASPMAYHRGGQILIGKGEKNGKKKKAIVTTVYTIAPAPRSPESVIERLFSISKAKPEKSSPATEEARRPPRTSPESALNEAVNAVGAAGIAKVDAAFPGFTRVLDFIHANEYLWQAAHALLGETSPARTAGVAARSMQLLPRQTDAVIEELRRLAAEVQRTEGPRKTLMKGGAYYERNRSGRDCDRSLKAGGRSRRGA